MLSCTEISCYIFFQFWEIWSETRVSFYATQSSYLLKTWKKGNFDMFYKNDCWAIICYPICMTNVSYERRIRVISFPDISFVILLFVYQRFEIKSGFPFFLYSHCMCIIKWTDCTPEFWLKWFGRRQAQMKTQLKAWQVIYKIMSRIYTLTKIINPSLSI